MPRLISAFSGTTGFVVKIVLLSISNALAVWAAYVLATRHDWVAIVVLAAATGLIDSVYLVWRAALPAKFLIPGTVLLACFELIPIGYTIDVAFTNYSTGHILTKAQAIQQIEITSLQAPANGKIFTLAVARDGAGKLALILQDQATKKFYAGTTEGVDLAGARSGHGQ